MVEEPDDDDRFESRSRRRAGASRWRPWAWSGWSLAAPEPGLAIMPDDVTHAEGPNESQPGLPLESSFKAHPKSLPTLRCGVSHHARLRLADIAGGGLRWTGEPSAVPGIEAVPVFYGRYAPVEAPSLALVRRASANTWRRTSVPTPRSRIVCAAAIEL